MRHGTARLAGLLLLLTALPAQAQTRLLRQPTLSDDHIAFAYAGDLWIVPRSGGEARRLTATAAVEADPHFSPDGRSIAFTSNRSGMDAVYVMPVEGGDAQRLTWYPAASFARGWTPDGRRVIYSSGRESAPTSHQRLWTVARDGGPSERVPAPWGRSASYAGDGRRMVVDRMDRWDVEWRGYRGGQNTPLTILSLGDLAEQRLPHDERTTDTHPLWLGNTIFFLSDRDRATNVWAYDVATGNLRQVTRFTNADVKSLSGRGGTLVFEQDGALHTHDIASGATTHVQVAVRGDFPWAQTRWVDAGSNVAAASLSPTGRRALMEARGEIFTVPVEQGDVRNVSRAAGAADRAPVWSPDGGRIAWFSDDGSGYVLKVAPQDGIGDVRTIDIGESKMAWDPQWSPDGSRIAFVDDRSRVRVVDVGAGTVTTADVDGTTNARGAMNLTWSGDSRWLAYTRSFPNRLRRIVVWTPGGQPRALTDAMADARSPAWDRDGRHLYFLASTDIALAAGWANTSSMQAQPTWTPYVMVLRGDDATPFPPRSDEETDTTARSQPADTASAPVRIDFDGVQRRVIALPVPAARSYGSLHAGPRGTLFITETAQGQPGSILHKFTMSDRKFDVYTRGVSRVSVSGDGRKLLYQSGGQWVVGDAARAPEGAAGRLTVALRMQVDPTEEWQQIFDESWRYQRDFFYDPGTHGADWDAVRRRYAPLVEHVRHRADLNYVIDMVNGELAVGHSFVGGGDLPGLDTVRVGLLGARLEADRGRWRIARIHTSESWNPGLSAPLDAPGLRVAEGNYILAVDGVEFTAADDPYRLLDGTAGRQTVLHVNDRPSMNGAWTVTVEPIRSEAALLQRAWVEDNRRRVDELSGGRLAYVWVPNTGGPGMVSFNRYYFAQQDRHGAVIDERYNGGGLLDDYMVDLMNRSLRAAITNEAPGGDPMLLPAGVLGPKVLLINELAGSGGDYFPWVFRHQGIGPLIGTRTWGGLVRSCSHYPMLDGGFVTSPCNAVFQPGVGWIAENEGVPPDIEVHMDARSVANGRDPQLERAVQEALRLLEQQGTPTVTPPQFPRPARWPASGQN